MKYKNYYLKYKKMMEKVRKCYNFEVFLIQTLTADIFKRRVRWQKEKAFYFANQSTESKVVKKR
jgi:hypothetical protein